MTIDISASGAVLSTADVASGPRSVLILIIDLPFADGCLVGRGHVARSVAACRDSATAHLAVAFEDLEILPRRSVSATIDRMLRPTHTIDI